MTTRRFALAILLGLLLATLCLLVGGTLAPADRRWACRFVVGTEGSDVQVRRCYIPKADKCFYINQSGAYLEVPCVAHPIAERRGPP